MLGLVFRRRPLLALFQLPYRWRLGHCKTLLSRTSPHHPAPPSVAMMSIFSILPKKKMYDRISGPKNEKPINFPKRRSVRALAMGNGAAPGMALFGRPVAL